MSDVVYVVGQNRGDTWEFAGVFDAFELAYAACLTSDFWIGQVRMNETFPIETQEWTELWWPKIGELSPYNYERGEWINVLV